MQAWDGRGLTLAEKVLVQFSHHRKPPGFKCSACQTFDQVYEKHFPNGDSVQSEVVCLACGLRKVYDWHGQGVDATDACLVCDIPLFRYYDVNGGTVKACALCVRDGTVLPRKRKVDG